MSQVGWSLAYRCGECGRIGLTDAVSELGHNPGTDGHMPRTLVAAQREMELVRRENPETAPGLFIVKVELTEV